MGKSFFDEITKWDSLFLSYLLIKYLTISGTLSRLFRNPLLPWSSLTHWFAASPEMAIDKFLLTCCLHIVYSSNIICEVQTECRVCVCVCVCVGVCVYVCVWSPQSIYKSMFMTSGVKFNVFMHLHDEQKLRLCVCLCESMVINGERENDEDGWELAVLAGLSANTHAVCMLYALRRRNVLAPL